MRVQSLVMALMIFSGVILGMTGFQGALMENYNKEPNTENITSLEKSTEVNNKMEKIQENIENFQVLNPLTWGNVVGLAVNMFSILFTIPAMVHGIVVDISLMLGLPGWFASFMEGVVLIALVFGAYRAIRGGQV